MPRVPLLLFANKNLSAQARQASATHQCNQYPTRVAALPSKRSSPGRSNPMPFCKVLPAARFSYIFSHPFFHLLYRSAQLNPADISTTIAPGACARLSIVHVAWRVGCAVLVLHLPPPWLILSNAMPTLACATVFACRIRLCHC